MGTFNFMIFVLQLMKDAVPVGEELKPLREKSNTSAPIQAEPVAYY
jgi:hypothetical protein